MGKNRLELRRMAEAAEKQEKASRGTSARKTKKRKATKRKTTTRKSKDKGLQRKRMVWCVFNGSMKEEGRFPYDQKEAAEAKLEQLRSKSKKLYFLQPVKEVIGDVAPPTMDTSSVDDEPDVDTDNLNDEMSDDDVDTDEESLEDMDDDFDDSDDDDDDDDGGSDDD